MPGSAHYSRTSWSSTVAHHVATTRGVDIESQKILFVWQHDMYLDDIQMYHSWIIVAWRADIFDITELCRFQLIQHRCLTMKTLASTGRCMLRWPLYNLSTRRWILQSQHHKWISNPCTNSPSDSTWFNQIQQNQAAKISDFILRWSCGNPMHMSWSLVVVVHLVSNAKRS